MKPSISIIIPIISFNVNNVSANILINDLILFNVFFSIQVHHLYK